jgi:hypothetical protein
MKTVALSLKPEVYKKNNEEDTFSSSSTLQQLNSKKLAPTEFHETF